MAEAHFRTTLAQQNQPHTITLHLDFLRRTQVGPALFTVQDKKIGRQTSVIHVSLSQGDRAEEVVGYITNSNMHTESGVSFPTGWELHPPPPRADLKLLDLDRDPTWARQGSMPFSAFRKASEKTQFHHPRADQALAHPRYTDEWIRLRTGERWTSETLGYVADMWPMPVEGFITRELATAAASDEDGKPSADPKKRTARFWYPTVLLNMDIKKPLPAEGVEWLFSRVAVKQIRNGRMDIEVVTLDADGEVVMLSHHVALAVGSERNLAERKKGPKI